MLVSVVIVNWNAREHLLRCLASLQRHPPPGDWEAVVVDNGSRDGSVEAVRIATPWARVMANATNRGLPAANNQGIAASTGDYVLVSNADVEYGAGAITSLCDALERHPRAAFAVPQLVQEGRNQTSAGSLPTLRETLLGGLDARRAKGVTDGYWWHRWPHDEERAIGHGAEAAYLVRRAAIEAVGPQDERFALDWEGIDWSARMADAGWEIWFVPQAVVEHAAGASIKQVPVRWIISSNRGMYLYFADRRPRWQRPTLAALFGSRALLKIAVTKAGIPVYDLGERRKRVDSAAIGTPP
jgi:GT2 family glycosyltransferase